MSIEKMLGLASITLLVTVSITDTVLPPRLATYSRVPLIANALGEEPTPMSMEKMLGLASIRCRCWWRWC